MFDVANSFNCNLSSQRLLTVMCLYMRQSRLNVRFSSSSSSSYFSQETIIITSPDLEKVGSLDIGTGSSSAYFFNGHLSSFNFWFLHFIPILFPTIIFSLKHFTSSFSILKWAFNDLNMSIFGPS